MRRHPVRILTTLLLLLLAAAPPALARRAATASRPFLALASGAPVSLAQIVEPVFAPSALPTLSAAEENAISRSSAGLVSFRLASGAVGMDLQGRFQDFAVANVDANGRIVVHCVDDAATLRQLLAAPVVTAPVVMEDR